MSGAFTTDSSTPTLRGNLNEHPIAYKFSLEIYAVDYFLLSFLLSFLFSLVVAEHDKVNSLYNCSKNAEV
jgi:hypothetical protein